MLTIRKSQVKCVKHFNEYLKKYVFKIKLFVFLQVWQAESVVCELLFWNALEPEVKNVHGVISGQESRVQL